jgi:hypothetical protein
MGLRSLRETLEERYREREDVEAVLRGCINLLKKNWKKKKVRSVKRKWPSAP